MTADNKIIGSFEPVGFPELGIKRTVAKIDTGAYTGALHATNMIEVSGKDGRPVLVFHPLGKSKLEARTTRYTKKRVRSSNGMMDERYVINTQIVVNDKSYRILITLSDRRLMKKEVLIGRRFLHRHGFVVDVRRGKQYAQAVKEEL